MRLPVRFAACLSMLLAFAAAAAPLGDPVGIPGAVVQETGEVSVGGNAYTVVRYTWSDREGRPRSVALRPQGGTVPGDAIRFTYQVDAGGGNFRTVNIDTPMDVGDGAFGYFVSHEHFRTFSDGGQGTIAERHGHDHAPLGNTAGANGIQVNGTASNTAIGRPTRWVHEFGLLYPRWGTTVAQNPDATVSADPAAHQLYMLPVTIRWSFVAGRDYPVWGVEADLSGLTDKVAMDVRGPYGVVGFNENTGPAVTAVRWGDRYRFAADAGASDIGAAALPANGLAWSWNTQNTGRRYHSLASGAYEFGLVDTLPASWSTIGESYALRRGATSAGGGCPDDGEMKSLPCGWEWPFQSLQHDFGPPARAKLGWGSSFYLGTSRTSVFINDAQQVGLQGTGRIAYNLLVVYGRQGSGSALALGEAEAPMPGPHNLEMRQAPLNGGSVTYQVTGDPRTYSDRNRALAPWSSVKASATPGNGWEFLGFDTDCGKFGTPGCAATRACAGSKPECRFTMDAPLKSVAVFAPSGTTIHPRPVYMEFPGQPVGVRSSPQALTIYTEVGVPQGRIDFNATDSYTFSDDPDGPSCDLGLAATSTADNFCRVLVSYTPRRKGPVVARSLTIATANSSPLVMDLEGSAVAGYPLLDVNLDRRSDLLWWNSETGEVWRSFMDGPTASEGAVAFTEPDVRWQIVGQGDFNSDGVTDLLYRHSDGRVAQVFFNSGGVAFHSRTIHREPSPNWVIAAVTDLDGDGFADIVWHNVATGDVYVMMIFGDTIKHAGMVHREADVNWRIVAAGHFGRDWFPDYRQNQLVWRHQVDGRVALQTVNWYYGTFYVGGVGPTVYTEPNPDWVIVGAADVDDDGISDLLWRNLAPGDGRVYMMMMRDGRVRSGFFVYREPNQDWRIVASGDYDGDGRADILWANTVTGEIYAQFMYGTPSGIVYRASGTQWKPVGPGMWSTR